MKSVSVLSVGTDLLKNSALWNNEDLPFKATLQKGSPKLMVVTGENSTGKSFFVECLRSWAKFHSKIATISVSIRERSGSGMFDMAGFRRSMMFGDECEQSTGATSVQVLGAAFNTAASRVTESKTPSLLVLDEPELGLSEGYACAMGTYLVSKFNELPDKICGVVVVTHSRGLVQALQEELGTVPTFVKLGAPLTLAQWLEQPETHTVEELIRLVETGREGRRAVAQLLKNN